MDFSLASSFSLFPSCHISLLADPDEEGKRAEVWSHHRVLIEAEKGSSVVLPVIVVRALRPLLLRVWRLSEMEVGHNIYPYGRTRLQSQQSNLHHPSSSGCFRNREPSGLQGAGKIQQERSWIRNRPKTTDLK